MPKSDVVLHRLDTGQQLMALIGGSHSSRTRSPDPGSEDEANLLADFVTTINDWADIWGDVGPGGQINAEFELTGELDRLREAGFVVYAGRRRLSLETGGGDTVPWSLVSIHRIDDPAISVADRPP
jgi:hypothetical protein